MGKSHLGDLSIVVGGRFKPFISTFNGLDQIILQKNWGARYPDLYPEREPRIDVLLVYICELQGVEGFS